MRQEFLSIRTDPDRKARLKALAAHRGTSVRALIETAVDAFLEDRQGDRLAGIIRTLRAHEPELRGAGIGRLWVFGSVARGDSGPDSDLDLLAEPAPGVRMSYLRLADWTERLQILAGGPVDVTVTEILRPSVHPDAKRDRVMVFDAP